jgi:hypothetical protein
MPVAGAVLTQHRIISVDTDDSRNVTNGGYLLQTTSDLDQVLVIDCVKVAAYQLPFVGGLFGRLECLGGRRHGYI